MSQIASDFIVRVSTQGVEQAKKQLQGLESKSSGAGTDQAKAFGDAARALDRMTSSADKLVGRLDKVARAMRKISQGARGVGIPSGSSSSGTVGGIPAGDFVGPAAPSSARGVARRGGYAAGPMPFTAPMPGTAPVQSIPMPTPTQRNGFNSGAFGHGLLQSLLPGNMGFIQRGPGAIAQGLGMMVGNIGAKVATSPLNGVQGLHDLISSIPLVGGTVAAPFSRFMGRADESMSFRRQQMELMPLLGSNQGIDMSGGVSEGSTRDIAKNSGMSYDETSKALSKFRRQRVEELINKKGAFAKNLMGGNISQDQNFRASLAASGGGSGMMMSEDFVKQAMVAKTTMGVGADVSGAFALGSRTNAVRGAGAGDPAAMLLDVMNQTKSLGLQGADAQQYLQQMADGIRQFQTSGIPLQKDSIYSLTSAFTGLGGMTGLAAQHAAMGITQSSSQFLSQGPESGFDLSMMRADGFQGGADDYLKHKRMLGTDPKRFASAMMKSLPGYASSPSRERNIESIRGILGQKGVTNDESVISSVVDSLMKDGTLPENFQKMIETPRDTSKDLNPLGSQQSAASQVPAFARQMADMQNQGVAVGADSTDITMEMETAANDAASVFSRFSGSMKKFARLTRAVTYSLTGEGLSAGPPTTRATN
jgi:hypothetical protein